MGDLADWLPAAPGFLPPEAPTWSWPADVNAFAEIAGAIMLRILISGGLALAVIATLVITVIVVAYAAVFGWIIVRAALRALVTSARRTGSDLAALASRMPSLARPALLTALIAIVIAVAAFGWRRRAALADQATAFVTWLSSRDWSVLLDLLAILALIALAGLIVGGVILILRTQAGRMAAGVMAVCALFIIPIGVMI